MNDRIIRYMNQLGISPWQVFPADMEKFAELIIRECIDAVLDCSVEYATRPQIAQELKEHFGVES